MSTEDAALALRRFGLGPRPGDIDNIAGDPRGALIADLLAPGAGRLDDADLPPSAAAFAAVRRDQAARREARRSVDAAGMRQPQDTDGSASATPPAARSIYRRELAARTARQLAAPVGLVERLVAFWSNHFAVQADKDEAIRGLAGAFEREAIRPHVLGRFEDMLVAATRHPAMLLSLDNVDSVGPDSPAGRRREAGLNENHAREILELHTVGVDGGYDQQDVTEFARMLTGWSFVRGLDRPDTGTFVFQPGRHEPGDRQLMGVVYRDEGRDDPPAGERQARSALAFLATHPATARHIAGKLARHFVDDQPPAALVDELASVFEATGGDLLAVTTALVRSDAAFGSGRKFATPQQFLVAAMRACGVDLDPQRQLALLRDLGEVPWAPTSPQGFHDDAANWLSPEGMTTRLDIADRLAQQAALATTPVRLADALLGPQLSAETRQALDRAESGRQAVALLLMSPEFQWR